MFDHSGFLNGLISIVESVVWLYFWVVVARVVISWVSPDPYNRIVQILCGLTDPALEGLRRFIPSFLWSTGLDFTPLILCLLLQIILRFLGSIHL